MKKIISLAILTLMIAAVFAASALAQDMGPTDIGDVLAQIRQAQGIGAADAIDVKKVSAGELEKFCDAVMELMVGNNALHEQMDERLGGDGSASLAAYRARLGYNYLLGYPNGMLSLMAGGMMGYIGAGGMMGSFGCVGCFSA